MDADTGFTMRQGGLRPELFRQTRRKGHGRGYKNGSKYASMGKYYRYIKQNSGDICIVKYDLHMRYAYDKLNGIVPSLEILTPVLGVVLFFLHATLLSGHFAKKLKRSLGSYAKLRKKLDKMIWSLKPDHRRLRRLTM